MTIFPFDSTLYISGRNSVVKGPEDQSVAREARACHKISLTQDTPSYEATLKILTKFSTSLPILGSILDLYITITRKNTALLLETFLVLVSTDSLEEHLHLQCRSKKPGYATQFQASARQANDLGAHAISPGALLFDERK